MSGRDWEAIGEAFEKRHGSWRQFLGTDESDPESLLEYMVLMTGESLDELQVEGQALLAESRLRENAARRVRLLQYLDQRDSWTTWKFDPMPDGMPTGMITELREHIMTDEERAAEEKRARRELEELEATATRQRIQAVETRNE